MPELFTLFWFAGFLELVGGFLVLIGFLTRPVAFVLSGQMAVAYWMAHAPQSIYPALNGGDAAILFCFIFLYLAVAGPGAFSVDGARDRAPAT
jgi:putative oxidoreductase